MEKYLIKNKRIIKKTFKIPIRIKKYIQYPQQRMALWWFLHLRRWQYTPVGIATLRSKYSPVPDKEWILTSFRLKENPIYQECL